jgi:hypothetical protein
MGRVGRPVPRFRPRAYTALSTLVYGGEHQTCISSQNARLKGGRTRALPSRDDEDCVRQRPFLRFASLASERKAR